jgi:hypothetical protein
MTACSHCRVTLRIYDRWEKYCQSSKHDGADHGKYLESRGAGLSRSPSATRMRPARDWFQSLSLMFLYFSLRNLGRVDSLERKA